MLVAVKGNRATVLEKISFQRIEVTERALGRHKAQLHQGAGRVVDEHEQGAGSTAILEPTVIGAIDLDQLAVAFPTKTWLVKSPTLLAREPDAILDHPFAQCGV